MIIKINSQFKEAITTLLAIVITYGEWVKNYRARTSQPCPSLCSSPLPPAQCPTPARLRWAPRDSRQEPGAGTQEEERKNKRKMFLSLPLLDPKLSSALFRLVKWSKETFCEDEWLEAIIRGFTSPHFMTRQKALKRTIFWDIHSTAI